MKGLAPDYALPMHCTGRNAIHRSALEMTDEFVRNRVATSSLSA